MPLRRVHPGRASAQVLAGSPVRPSAASPDFCILRLA